MNISKLGSSLVSKVDFYENTLNVKVVSSFKSNSIFFACYLMQDEEVIVKYPYSRCGNFNFEINQIKNQYLKVYIYDKFSNLRTHKKIFLAEIVPSSKYYLCKEKSFLSERNTELGYEFFTNKKLFLTKCEGFNVKEEIDFYNMDPFNNNVWVWWLFQLQHLVYLVAYLDKSETKNAVLVDIHKYILLFIEYKNRDKHELSRMLWQDHATALRLKNLTFLFGYLKKNKLFNQDFYFDLIFLIMEHIEKLSKNDFYSKHTNHGFDQSLYLFQAILELEKELNVFYLAKLAEKRIVEEISFAFSEDGGHKENSPGYLNFGIKQCLQFIEICEKYNKENSNINFIKSIIDKSTLALAYFTKPNGKLPLIGDTSTYKVTDIFSIYKPVNYKYFRYSISQGERGCIPPDKWLVLKESGYAIYRSSWEKGEINDSIYFTMKAGYKSNYHRHDDDLSITLFAFDEDWLIDGGIYKYSEKNINRKYIRSHLSHNISSPVGHKANRSNINFHNVFLKEIPRDDNGFDVEGVSSMFKNIEIKRRVSINNLNEIKILDTLHGCNEEFESVTRFFIPFDKKVFIEGKSVYIVGKNKSLFLNFNCDHDIRLSLIVASEKNEIGWLSNITNELVKTNVIEIVTINSDNNFSIETVCKFLS